MSDKETLSIVAKKTLGQNFLYDKKITDKIVRDENFVGKIVIEIGPGLGLLTESILEKSPEKLILVEKDSSLIKFLASKFPTSSYPNLLILEQDALEFKIKNFVDHDKVTIISNLPYNISVKLLTNWFDEIEQIEMMILMFQKEVALRLNAEVSSKAYGSLSIITQCLFNIFHQFDLPPGAFNPAPKINSSILKLVPKKEPSYKFAKDRLEYLSKALFGQRRKMLSTILKNHLKIDLEILEKLNIDGTKRPENLSLEEFCLLSLHI